MDYSKDRTSHANRKKCHVMSGSDSQSTDRIVTSILMSPLRKVNVFQPQEMQSFTLTTDSKGNLGRERSEAREEKDLVAV